MLTRCIDTSSFVLSKKGYNHIGSSIFLKKKINYLSMNLTLFIYLCRSQNFIMMETSKLTSMCDHWLGVQINELHTTLVTMSMGLGSVLNNAMMVKKHKIVVLW